jgi:hypothetical protein
MAARTAFYVGLTALYLSLTPFTQACGLGWYIVAPLALSAMVVSGLA